MTAKFSFKAQMNVPHITEIRVRRIQVRESDQGPSFVKSTSEADRNIRTPDGYESCAFD
jgi:hypothetical protein